MSVLLLILGLALFVMLVVVHEWGHFIVARRNKVDVEEFGIGFPPKVWGRKMKSGFLFTINLLPLGGFVKLKGEHDADTKPGTFGAAKLSVKTRILLAGVGMNLLTALIMLTIIAWAGMPVLIDNQFTIKRDTKTLKNEVLVGFVEPNSPAEKAGLQVKDRLIQIGQANAQALCANDTVQSSLACPDPLDKVTSASQLPKLTKTYASQSIPIFIMREGKTLELHATLRSAKEVLASQKTSNPVGYLGVSPTEYTLRRSTWSAPVVAIGLASQITKLTLLGIGHALGQLFIGHASQASQQVTGPVGIFALFKSGSLLGYQFILMLVAIISLTLAIMNALPIPALDGGRLFVMWLFRLMRRPLSKSTEDRIHGTGFAVLMILFVLITIVDVRRFF